MQRLKLISAIGEAAIPLFGVLFLGWGLYFILLYYFLDLIVNEIFVYIKVNKAVDFQLINFSFRVRYGRLIFNSALALLVLLLTHVSVYFIVPEINFWKEFVAFLRYKEDGIPIAQGYILLPMVLLGNYQQYKMVFIKSGEFKRISWSKLIYKRRNALFIAIAGTTVSLIIAIFFSINEPFYVYAIIFVKLLVDIRL